jgi:hypothetical protein
MLTASLSFHALLETGGPRRVFLAVIFIGIAPIMVGATLAAASNSLLSAGLWIAGLSPFAAPVFASQMILPAHELPLAAARAIPSAFWFWQGVAALVAGSLVIHLWRQKRARAGR